ncbi:MAG: ATP synthase F1 subunit delta [Thermoguttaceae bacterium]
MAAESRDITAEDAQVAAQIEADVGVEHIAGVYAKALLDTVEKSGQTASALAEFDAIVADVLDPFPKLEAVLASALVSANEKAAVLDRVLGGRALAVVVDFLKIVARHGRLDCLRAIHHQTHVLDDVRRNRIPVQLTTAMPIGAAAVERIAVSLRAKLGGEPIFQQRTDPALIGGAVLRIGDTVYDGSIANELEILRQQMIEKSDHEIQSRRDRFSNPTGN